MFESKTLFVVGAGASAEEAAGRIRTFTEQMEDEDSLRAIHESVLRAETMVFLGFGFHPQNMELLSVGIGNDVRRVFATSFCCSNGDIEVFIRQVREMLGDEHMQGGRFEGYEVDVRVPFGLQCSQLFSEFSRSIPQKID